jgi:hypothetical protein
VKYIHYKYWVLSAISLLTFIISKAQHANNNSLSGGIGKTGLIFNIIYDHGFNNKIFGIQLGAGSNFSGKFTAATAGGGAYYLVGKQNIQGDFVPGGYISYGFRF